MRRNREVPIGGGRERGIALIIVLAGLVLVTILVLAFLTGIGSELQSSKMYANGSSVKLLAQSSVALVTGEIQAATADPTLDWASQPGMIRTYSNTGTATAYYKLYSDAGMYGTGTFDATNTVNLVPNHLYNGGETDWYNQAGVYVDLNEPVYVNGTNYYPILDGNSSDYSSTQYTDTLSTLTVPKASTSAIKTLTPMSSSLPAVTGFWLDGNTPVNTAKPNVAPMPVRWLYVLKNGEVIVPDSNPVNNVVTFKNATSGNGSPQAQPSSTDPIVGRIAFWTDDETCKVNINTASDGNNVGSYGFNNAVGSNTGSTTGSVNASTMSSFWDTPRTYTPKDFGYAFSQPVQNEFQRYPGHPATVALSAVFNAFTADANFPENSYSSGSTTPSIAPRYSRGGSLEGTLPTFSSTATTTIPLTPLGWRLYSTPDELLYQPTLSGTPGTGTRTLNTSQYAELTPALLQQAKFFITADSEAPDVNTFNLPRVSMWPITLNSSTGSQTLSAYDQVLSFCSTLNGNIYYFQRQNPNSSSADLPTNGAANGVGRNRELLEYLRTLTSQNIPGFGGNFSAKYGSPGDRDQILTEMFDYIRCTNLEDASTGTASQYTQCLESSPSSLTTPSATTATTDPFVGGGMGQVVPIVDTNISITDTVGSGTTTNPRGFGRFPTVQQAALIFIGAGDNNTCPQTSVSGTSTGTYTNYNPGYSYNPEVASGKERVQAGFFLQMSDPSEGLPVAHPWYAIQVTGLDNLLWNGQSIFPANASYPWWTKSPNVATYLQPLSASANAGQLYATNYGNGFTANSYGGLIDFRQQSLGRDNVLAGSASAPTNPLNKFFYLPIYPYISPPTGMSSGQFSGMPATAPDMTRGSTFTLSNQGDVTVSIYAVPKGWSATSPGSVNTASGPTLVQTVNLKFPTATCPVPYSINENITYTYTSGTITGTNTPLAPYNTSQYTNVVYNNLPNWPSGYTPPTPVTPANYLPPTAVTSSGTVTGYTPFANFQLDNFLGFFDGYGGSVDTYGVGVKNYGRLGWGSTTCYITPADVVRAIVVSDPSSSTTAATAGDIRLVAARQSVPDSFYQPIEGSNFPATADYTKQSTWFSHMLRVAFGCPLFGSAGGALVPVSNMGYYASYQTQFTNSLTLPNASQSAGATDVGDTTYALEGRSPLNVADNDVANQLNPVNMAGSSTGTTVPGDWDTGLANTRDGAYINKPDEGDMGNPQGGQGGHVEPYYELNAGYANIGSSFFSPNRMIPSPGMFGSLPTGVWADRPWQTLLFRPGPAKHKGLGISSSGSGDYGAPYTTPPDHLFMDLFNMPVVEPYAISTPLATAGRINMNYQIVPFTYINRDTGLRAVLKNQMMACIPATTTAEGTYKSSSGVGAGAPSATGTPTTRYSINLDSTLSQFLARFYGTAGTQGSEMVTTSTAIPDIFHSASEICDVDLVPNDTTAATASDLKIPITRANMDAYWAANALTGDNIRERPYANIYPLLTTKSNTFTVHFRVQTLKQTPTTANWAQWREGTDVVLSEYRGSQTIERYVDLTNTQIPDYAAVVSSTQGLPPASDALSQYYKFRVVSTKQFPP